MANKDKQQLLKMAQQAVESGKKAGADEVFATTSNNREVKIKMRDGKVETVKEAVSNSLSVRIWSKGRYGSHRSNDLRPTELKKFIEDAVILTQAIQPDEHRKITDPSLYENRPEDNLNLHDPKVHELSREERLQICLTQNETLMGSPKIISTSSGVSDTSYISAKASSNGFADTQTKTSFWFGCDITLQDKGDKKPKGWMWAGARHRADTPDVTSVAQITLKRAQAMLGAQKGPSKKTLMVVDPYAGARLVSRLIGPANGRSFSQSQSFWKDKIGKKSVSEKLTLTDNPLLKRGLASRRYDGDGISAGPMKVIEDGVLNHIYVDTYYGSKLAMAPTTGGRSNLILNTGKRNLETILADCPDAFYVTSWLGGNSDGVTGDYSFGFRGFLVKDGKLDIPVGEMNITGNLLTLFSGLLELGNDPWPYSSIQTPTLVFEGVDFSGT